MIFGALLLVSALILGFDWITRQKVVVGTKVDATKKFKFENKWALVKAIFIAVSVLYFVISPIGFFDEIGSVTGLDLHNVGVGINNFRNHIFGWSKLSSAMPAKAASWAPPALPSGWTVTKNLQGGDVLSGLSLGTYRLYVETDVTLAKAGSPLTTVTATTPLDISVDATGGATLTGGSGGWVHSDTITLMAATTVHAALAKGP